MRRRAEIHTVCVRARHLPKLKYRQNRHKHRSGSTVRQNWLRSHLHRLKLVSSCNTLKIRAEDFRPVITMTLSVKDSAVMLGWNWDIFFQPRRRFLDSSVIVELCRAESHFGPYLYGVCGVLRTKPGFTGELKS